MGRSAHSRRSERRCWYLLLCALRPLEGTAHPHAVTNIPAGDVEQLPGQWLIDGNARTAAQRSLVGLVGLSCRAICGMPQPHAGGPPRRRNRAATADPESPTSSISGLKKLKLWPGSDQ